MFVWGCGVLFLSCACVSVSEVLFSVGVCVWPVDMFCPTCCCCLGGWSTRHPGTTPRLVCLVRALACGLAPCHASGSARPLRVRLGPRKYRTTLDRFRRWEHPRVNPIYVCIHILYLYIHIYPRGASGGARTLRVRLSPIKYRTTFDRFRRWEHP